MELLASMKNNEMNCAKQSITPCRIMQSNRDQLMINQCNQQLTKLCVSELENSTDNII